MSFPPIPTSNFEVFVLLNLIALNLFALEFYLRRLLKYRHTHDWERAVLYGSDLKPQAMLRICDCGEVKFDGWFEKEIQK